MKVDKRLKKWNGRINLRIYKREKFYIYKIKNQMKILRRQWLEEMKDWTKKTTVDEDERLNKKKKIDVNDVVQKEFCKLYWKTSNIIYIV